MSKSNLFMALPLVHVSSSVVAEAFYCGQLGFEKESEYRPDPRWPDPAFLSLARESFSGDGVAGGVVGFAVRDVDALHAEFVARDVQIVLPPTDQTWGNREMYVRDADGNSLRFLQSRG